MTTKEQPKEEKKEQKENSASLNIIRPSIGQLLKELNRLIENRQLIKEANISNIKDKESSRQDSERDHAQAKELEIERRLKEVYKEINSILRRADLRRTSIESSGMTHGHSLTLAEFSIANDVVGIWRPVNPETASLLEGSEDREPYMGKGLNIKGKSSEFGPIAGDIPCDAALSKVAADDKLVKKFQKINKETLIQAEAQYEKIKNSVTKENMAEINDLLLVTAKPKMVNGQQVYYSKNEDGNVELDKNNEPVFFIKREEDSDSMDAKLNAPEILPWLAYDKNSKQFNMPYTPPKADPLPVKIMAYRQFYLVEGKITCQPRLITADYDELVSSSRKIYPFINNEEIFTKFTKYNYNELAQALADNRPIDVEKLIFELILAYEQQLKRDHRYTITAAMQPHMGNVNEWQRAIKAFLKYETKGAISHGPEVNNPYPEELSPGNYTVYLPDGRSLILHAEDEICSFINIQRKNGFPLDVNSKWGWEIDEQTGDLYVPRSKFKWKPVHEILHDRYVRLELNEDRLSKLLEKMAIKNNKYNREQLVKDENLDPSKLELIPDNKASAAINVEEMRPLIKETIIPLIKEINNMEGMYVADTAIINLKVQIERLRLEPDINYSDEINNEFQLLEVLEETPEEGELRAKMVKRLKEREHQQRPEKIEEMELRSKMAKRLKEREHQQRFEKVRELEKELIALFDDHHAKYRQESTLEDQEAVQEVALTRSRIQGRAKPSSQQALLTSISGQTSSNVKEKKALFELLALKERKEEIKQPLADLRKNKQNAATLPSRNKQTSHISELKTVITAPLSTSTPILPPRSTNSSLTSNSRNSSFFSKNGYSATHAAPLDASDKSTHSVSSAQISPLDAKNTPYNQAATLLEEVSDLLDQVYPPRDVLHADIRKSYLLQLSEFQQHKSNLTTADYSVLEQLQTKLQHQQKQITAKGLS